MYKGQNLLHMTINKLLESSFSFHRCVILCALCDSVVKTIRIFPKT